MKMYLPLFEGTEKERHMRTFPHALQCHRKGTNRGVLSMVSELTAQSVYLALQVVSQPAEQMFLFSCVACGDKNRVVT